jgi:hypothetical protein
VKETLPSSLFSSLTVSLVWPERRRKWHKGKWEIFVALRDGARSLIQLQPLCPMKTRKTWSKFLSNNKTGERKTVKRKEKNPLFSHDEDWATGNQKGQPFFLGRFLKMDVVGREVVGDSWVLPCLQAVEWSEICEHCVREREKQKETSKRRRKTH